jgi:hypothetical protein
MNRNEDLIFNVGDSGWMFEFENSLSAKLTKIVASRVTKIRINFYGRLYILKEYRLDGYDEKKWFNESFLESVFFKTKDQVKEAAAKRIVFID